VLVESSGAAAATRSPLRRLLGPVAELAASVQWIRFQKARLEGRPDLALARAESALELAPENPAGWRMLSSHLALFLSSPEREPDPALRLRWFRAGIEVARTGQARADDPADLAIWRSVLFSTKAEVDPELPWPGGTAALWEEAARALEEAAELGAPGVGELAEILRERIEEE
jgi:hypothetical protein